MSLVIDRRSFAPSDATTVAMAAAFVVLWSSGFIGAKYGVPHAGAFTLLTLRFLLAAAILLPALFIWRAPWPRSLRDTGHIAVAGLLLNVGCLGGCVYAISLGLPAAIVAVIGGLQPLLTGILAGAVLGERVSARQWLGLGLGFGGVVLVLSDKLSLGSAPPQAIAAAFIGLAGLTLATLYQKRFCANVPLRSGAAIQLTAAAAVTLPLGIALEGFTVDWGAELVLVLIWLAVGLSIGALMLLWALVKRGAAAKVSSLFYLTPPTTALMGWLLFDERFGAIALAGMAVVVAGVALATREQPAAGHRAG
jgi:drug/metabolite transporter (DMT)-like permease